LLIFNVNNLIFYKGPEVGGEDAEMQKAIADSLQTNNYDNFTYEPLPPKERRREPGIPVGLKNVGNTCYFNSLIQTYFNIPAFVELIMKSNTLDESAIPAKGDKEKAEAKPELVNKLKELFTTLIKSNKKYQDASDVLRALRDEFGNPIPIGDQKDISEFHLQFINCLYDEMKPKEDVKHEEVKVEPKVKVEEEVKEGSEEDNKQADLERKDSKVSESALENKDSDDMAVDSKPGNFQNFIF
jgi:ubiquitin carboxyl-terminal hydrolase 25/28